MNSEEKVAAITSKLLNKPKTVGFFVFLFLLLPIALITIQRYRIVKENERREMNNVLNAAKQNIEQSMKNSYTAALTLALTLNDNGIPKNFEAVAAQLVNSNPGFQAVQLVPDSIIKYIYPLKGNEAALNANIFTDNTTKENILRAQLSIKNKKMYFLGPSNLIQGGLGVVGRLPIFLENKFWGFSAVVIKLDTFLNQVGTYNGKKNKFYFQFSRLNFTSHKEEFFLAGNKNFQQHTYESVLFPDGNWKLYLIATDRYEVFYQIAYSLAFGFILAIACSLLIVQLLKKPAELQRLVHEQATQLMQTEIKFKTIFDEAAIGIALVRADNGNFIEANKRLCEILGHTEEELHQLNFQNLTISDEIGDELNNLEKLRSGEINEFKTQVRYINPNGQIKWANIVETPLWNEGLKPVSHIFILEDITDRKNAEKIILDSQLRTESLINTIDGIVWEADPRTFQYSFISKKTKDITGYTYKEWLASPTFWPDHIHPEDRDWVLEYCDDFIKSKKQHTFEYRMIAKDGSIVWFRDSAIVIFENDEPILLRGIMIDISENKRAQKALNDSFTLVSEQNKRLLDFSYIVSHNLRSHSSNIQAITNLIEITESEEERMEMVGLLKNVSGLLNETMYNLNKVVNIQASIDVVTESLNLKVYINKTLDILNDQIALKQAEIKNDVPGDVLVNYNPAYLESVLLNFIFNAIKYSHPNRKPLIELSAFIENGQHVFQVSDNGIGIDVEKYGDQLFGMYKTFNDHADSKGVGLFISKNQIDAMGGKVTVSSILNKGTTFKIYFK